jgi:hypothetical protein
MEDRAEILPYHWIHLASSCHSVYLQFYLLLNAVPPLLDNNDMWTWIFLLFTFGSFFF